MEVAIEKGARSWLGLVFGVGRTQVGAGRTKSTRAGCKLPWARTKSAWEGPQVVQPGF